MALWGAKSDKVALLRKVAFFDGLSAQQLSQVARLADDVEVEAGRKLASAGDTGRELFIIVDGEAVVRPARGRAIRLGRGDFFGEMSLIDGAPRSATVESTTPMRLLVVGQREFWQLLATAPAISRRIMHAMAERLREANAAYSANP
jgi:CPA1 family monovalent cation:H+ antiporter